MFRYLFLKQVAVLALLLITQLGSAQTVRIHFTQWKSDANWDVYLVDRPQQADVVLCVDNCTKNRAQIVSYRMSADYVMRPVSQAWSNTLRVYIQRQSSSYIPTRKQTENFESLFREALYH